LTYNYINIQTCLQKVTDSTPETKTREFGAYDNINDNYPKYVITLDKPEEEINGIKQINLLKFLLDDNF